MWAAKFVCAVGIACGTIADRISTVTSPTQAACIEQAELELAMLGVASNSVRIECIEARIAQSSSGLRIIVRSDGVRFLDRTREESNHP